MHLSRFTVYAAAGALLGVFLSAAAIALSAGNAAGAPSSPQKAPVRVAVFYQQDFPTYGIGILVSPQQIARNLKAAGIAADLLDADALARPDRLNARRYAAVVLPYGNTYPSDAFANLRRFHQERGSLITTGIPFTHAAARGAVRDWDANPHWGGSATLVPRQGNRTGTNAIRLQIEDRDWTGVSSSRFTVRPGDSVAVSAALKDVTPQRSGHNAAGGRARTRPDASRTPGDHLYVRFYDSDRRYLEQRGISLTLSPSADWQTVRVAAVKAPAGAAFADLSLQLSRRGHTVLASDFSSSVNGKSVALPNAGLSRISDAFLDLGHSVAPALWGPEGIGIGGFDGPESPEGPAPGNIAPGDPLRLTSLFAPRPPATSRTAPQWLDPHSVPAGVRIIPALGTPKRPLIALLIQEKGPFQGAVDAWTYRVPDGDREDYYGCQLVARATVAALSQRGLVNASAAFHSLDSLPRPTILKDVTPPVVSRRYETFQPRMPAPARHLYVADLRGRTNDEKLLFLSLQGIVNRKQPRIYFVFDEDDRRWLKVMQNQGVTDTPISVSDPWSLVDTFRTEFQGTVICDPKVYVSPCVAVSLAGADDLLVAMTPQLAERVHASRTEDLRGRFKDNANALHYLRTSVAPHLDPYLTCTLDPAVFAQGGLDSIIAARGSVFWITGLAAQQLPGANSFGETAEVNALLAGMPLGAVVRGFWWHGDGVGLQESDGVALASRLGKVTLVSDLITNLSVHSGVPAERLKQKPRPPAPPLDRKKVYVAFTMSDGDNLCTWRGYFRRYFSDPVRGTFPVGWGMSPAILDLAPGWARWYYENATPNDEFICDVSGVAYMYPSSWGVSLTDRESAFRWFYGKTQDYMERMDMNSLRLMDVSAEDIARVGPLLPGLDYLLPDYGYAGAKSYRDLTYTLPTGQAVFRAATSGSGPEHLAEQIRARAKGTRPAFVNAFIWNWGSSLSDLKKTLDLLGPDYVAVTPSQLNTLYRQSQQHKTATTTVQPRQKP